MAKKRNPEHLLRVSAYSHDPKDHFWGQTGSGLNAQSCPSSGSALSRHAQKSYSLSALCCIIMKVSNVYSET